MSPRSEKLEAIKVYTLGVASIMPLLAYIILCMSLDTLWGLPLFLVLHFGPRALLGVRFSFEVARNHRIDTTTTVFWVLGLLFFMTIFVIPYYWYTFHWQPYRSHQLYDNL
jgi:hypothetical protein